MKKFLFYFHFTERYVNKTYETVNEVPNTPQCIKSFSILFEKNLRSLAERLHWCAITVFSSVDEKDLSDFMKIKEVRDKLSHEKHVEESELPIEKTRELTLKLLSTKKK